MVSEWSESQSPVCPVQRRRSLTPPALFGLAGTLVLHAIALQTVLDRHPAKTEARREISMLGSSPSKLNGKPAERLVYINLPGRAKTDHDGDIISWAKLAMKMAPIKVDRLDSPAPLNIETLALDGEQESKSLSSNDDGTEFARLYGIYTGQIQARVERTWNRPRTRVNDESSSATTADAVDYFHCQVEIAQDATGNVQEVLLLNCNGTMAWQRSLVMAIQQASPLPAPPDPTVFNRAVTLEFRGYPYIAGSSEEGYEALRSDTAIVAHAKTPEQVAREFLPLRPAVSK